MAEVIKHSVKVVNGETYICNRLETGVIKVELSPTSPHKSLSRPGREGLSDRL
jgi:hypothetical protein